MNVGMRGDGIRRALAPILGLALLLAACSQGSDDTVAESQALFVAGEKEAALDLLRTAAAKDPADGEIQLAIGLTLLRMGRAGEAVFPLRKAARSEELLSTAGLLLATTLLGGGNLEEAIAATDRMLESDPEDENALVVRANAALGLHRSDVALDAASRLQTLNPDSLTYRRLNAMALVEADRLAEAETLLLSIAEIEDAEGDEPMRACVGLAKVLADADEEERAVERLAACEVRFGERAEAVIAMVATYDSLGRDRDGTELLARTLKLFPDSTRLRAALGNRLIAADRFDEAEGLMREDLEEDEGPERWAAVAMVRTVAGDLEGAAEALDRAISISLIPVEEHLFRRADLMVSLGDVPEAESLLAQLTEPLYVRAMQARIAQERGHPQEALDLFETVIPQWPENYGLRVFAALAALDLGRREKAKSELLEAHRQAPKESDAAIWLARMHFADGEYDLAILMARRQIEERGPSHPDAFILAARAFHQTGRIKAARKMINQLLEVRDGLFKPEAVAELGRTLASLQGAEKSVAPYDQLVSHHELDLADPANEPALAQLLQLLSDAGQLDEAERRLRRWVAARPEQPNLLAMQGRVAFLQDDLKAASDAFDRALELDHELPSGLAGRAMVLRANGDLAAAAEAADRAWQLSDDPDHGYLAGRLQLDLGHVEKAQTRFSDLLRLHPDHAAAANDLAWLLAEQGKSLEQAQRLAELAVRLTPGAEVLDTLGYVQLKRGDPDAAIGPLRRAIDAKPDYATAHFHLALALDESGRSVEARESLVTALKTSFPESDQARTLLTKLEEAGGTAP